MFCLYFPIFSQFFFMRESPDLHVHRIFFQFVFKDSVFFISLFIYVFSVNFDEIKRRTQDSVNCRWKYFS